MKTNILSISIVKKLSTGLFILLISLSLVSCSEDVTPSLWQEKPKGETPVISSLDPPDKGLAGVTKVTITGENFSENPGENFVYFGSAMAEILQYSSTQLVVKAPNVVGDSIIVKVAVHGAELFSENYLFVLNAAVSEVYPFKDFEQPYALTLDTEGNIFFSFVSANAGQGVKKLTTGGEILDFVPKGGETFYNGLKYGAGGILYGARAVRAIFQLVEGENPTPFAAFANGTQMLDVDFDQNLNMWTGGNGGMIFSATPEKEVGTFDFEPKVSSVRVFNDYLYVSAEDTSVAAVWKFQINSYDNLGEPEKYFDFSANYPIGTVSMKAITFSADGDLFIGTDGEPAMIVVYQDGTFEEWYPGLINSPVLNFAWGTGETLYYSRGVSGEFNQTIIAVEMERNGAPHFGRD